MEPTAADVQEELQDYLNSKNINALFIQIVEKLLIEKPDNPIGFMVEYLQKTYPEETANSMLGGGKDLLRAVSNESKEGGMSDDDDEDVVDDLEFKEINKRASMARRGSISAESIDPNKANGMDIKKIPKTKEESARIAEILKTSPFLQHLEEKNIKTLEDAFFKVEKKKGDVVIKQGDMGDNFYVIDTGSVKVYKQEGEKPEIEVNSLGSGDSFGELAIMYNAPRAATCKVCSESCKLWALDRLTFKTIIMQAAISKRSQYKEFLQKVKILQQLDEYEILTISDCLVEQTFADGDVVVKQGEPGDTFYIVKEGVAVCSQKDTKGIEKEVAVLKDGEYFGEIALLTKGARRASVSARGNLTLLSLDQKTFNRVMGPVKDTLNRNMETYNSVVASTI